MYSECSSTPSGPCRARYARLPGERGKGGGLCAAANDVGDRAERSTFVRPQIQRLCRDFAGTRYAKVNREKREMAWWRVRAAVGSALVAALCSALGGCLSPTLPVPPPEPVALQEPLAKLQAGGKSIRVEGTDALKGALVAMWNEELQEGMIVKADDRGAYQSVLAVDVSCTRPQNHIQLWQTDMDGKTSEAKTYRLPNTFGDVPLPPDDAGCPDAGTADVEIPSDADAGTD
jgi:hypothetical protein